MKSQNAVCLGGKLHSLYLLIRAKKTGQMTVEICTYLKCYYGSQEFAYLSWYLILGISC